MENIKKRNVLNTIRYSKALCFNIIPLKKGIIITPGIYIPYNVCYPKEYQGIGIIIENNFVICDKKPINLSKSIPEDKYC
ncbi:hypothetical protein H8356DRAFT_1348598 [Neocallimastix lanati (nom. inval.)]|nr:hypothetical protein H8356DRAFT_1348598 [Neocallimastix sp. JGI-2020a]